jgi:hypothetical protein
MTTDENGNEYSISMLSKANDPAKDTTGPIA